MHLEYAGYLKDLGLCAHAYYIIMHVHVASFTAISVNNNGRSSFLYILTLLLHQGGKYHCD